MAKFFWRERPRQPLEARFDEKALGYRAWRNLVRGIEALRDDYDRADEFFDRFLKELKEIDSSARPATPCLFISHRMTDVNEAVHVASLATQAGYDYWLDIHDPLLVSASKTSLPTPIKEILIAAIIEIALLNVTHVIALHTRNSIGSKWIPYELGRAKARLAYSSNAAGWFDSHTSAQACGEYVHLAHQTWSDSDISNWLARTRI